PGVRSNDLRRYTERSHALGRTPALGMGSRSHERLQSVPGDASGGQAVLRIPLLRLAAQLRHAARISGAVQAERQARQLFGAARTQGCAPLLQPLSQLRALRRFADWRGA